MKATFVEATGFTEWVSGHLPDDAYAALQRELMSDPERGEVMKGCGGLRKLRVAGPTRGKGKRGGARIIYLHVPEAKSFFMLDAYGKDEKDDLGAQERKELARLAGSLKQQAIAAAARGQGRST